MKRLIIIMVFISAALVTPFIRDAMSGPPGKSNQSGKNGGAPHFNLTYQLNSSGEQTVLHIGSRNGKFDYKPFLLDSPKRFVVDIPHAAIATSPDTLTVDRPELTAIRIAEHSDKVRFVFDLPGDESVNCEIDPAAEGINVTASHMGKRSVTHPEPVESPLRAEPPQTLLTLELVRKDLREFFERVSRETGVEFKVAPEIDEECSLGFQEVPVQKALQVVGELYQLRFTEGGGVIAVDYTEQKKRENLGKLASFPPPG